MVVFMWALSLYVGFVYTILTISAVMTAKSNMDLALGLLLIFPPAVLGILVVASRMIIYEYV